MQCLSFCGWLVSLSIMSSRSIYGRMGVHPIPTWECRYSALQDSDFSSFGYIPRNEIAGWYSSSILIFWGTTILFPTVAASFYIPSNSVKEFQFLHLLASTCYFLFYSSHPNRCEVISHCLLDLRFPDD